MLLYRLLEEIYFLLSNSSDNIDPESSYSAGNAVGLERAGMPVPRTIGLNINLKF